MFELVRIIIINLAIALALLLMLGISLNYWRKRILDEELAEMKSSYEKYAANPKRQAQFERQLKEWERKHPFKALKQRVKRKFWWLIVKF